MDLVYLFRVILKRKWIIIGSAILAAGIAYYFTRNEAKTYLSTTRVSTGFAVPDEIKVNENNFTLFDAEVKFNNAITTWTSPSVISLLSYQLILHDLDSSSPFRRLTKEQEQSPIYKAINKEEARKVFKNKLDSMSVLTVYRPEEKKLVEFLALYKYDVPNLNRGITINQVPRTDFIQVDCRSENPELSAFIVNNVFQQFIRYYRSIRSTKSQESVDTLRSIMDKKKEEWDVKTKQLRGESLVDAETENTSKLDLISEMEKTLTDEKSKQTDNYSALRKVNQKLSKLGVSTTENTNPDNSNNSEELIIARKAASDAYREYVNSNMTDKTLLDKYNRLFKEYNTKLANSRTTPSTERTSDNKNQLLDQKDGLEIDIQASDEKIKSIEEKIGSLRASVNSTSKSGATVETMQEDVKLAQKEYLDAQKKWSDAYDMSSSSVNNFRQPQLAQPAIGPEPSKRKVIVGMAGVVTFLSALLIIVLLTYLDSSIKTPVIFSKMVGLKLISMVNFMNLKKKDLKDIVAGHGKEDDRIEKKRSNVFRESIRKLRYEIEKSGKKIILFTSTKKGQGKTTLIQALSYSMSLSKKKILIIDTNFCNNDLTVQLEANPVLETISGEQGNGSIASQVTALSKNIGVESVFVIGSEGGDYTPSEVLPYENLLKHLQELTPEYDYIFLEGPPLNDFSDSKELLQYVDGVVGIFSAIHIIKQIDKDSIGFYKGLDDKFIGSVLNMVDLENVNVI